MHIARGNGGVFQIFTIGPISLAICLADGTIPIMNTKNVCLRLPDVLRREAEKLAAAKGAKLSEWIRGLIERETGIVAPMGEPYLQRIGKRKRREIASLGGKAKAESSGKA